MRVSGLPSEVTGRIGTGACTRGNRRVRAASAHRVVCNDQSINTRGLYGCVIPWAPAQTFANLL